MGYGFTYLGEGMKKYYNVVTGCAVKSNQKKKVKHAPSRWTKHELLNRLHNTN